MTLSFLHSRRMARAPGLMKMPLGCPTKALGVSARISCSCGVVRSSFSGVLEVAVRDTPAWWFGRVKIYDPVLDWNWPLSCKLHGTPQKCPSFLLACAFLFGFYDFCRSTTPYGTPRRFCGAQPRWCVSERSPEYGTISFFFQIPC